ncbi:YqcI/YcgG family protein [Bacillus sp. C11]|nr:YqcI/YcgG family protein [Neobacillus terrae]NHM30854.1 YqcI/YcgG family protein [Neobacillus terrae]
MKRLYTNDASQREQLKQWEKSALEKFEEKMLDKEKPFPCIPATIGYAKNRFLYGFADDPRKASSIDEAAGMLCEYSSKFKQIGSYTSLIIFYKTPEILSVEQFEQLFWEQLNGFANRDELKWPDLFPTDPHNPMWEFCFNGEQYFMYCASPAHTNRKSRHFDYFMLAVTPRWVLQEFNKSENQAKRIRSHVRERLSNYDSIGIHPDLNTYGNDYNYEWKQYFLRDDGTSLSKCPFHNPK